MLAALKINKRKELKTNELETLRAKQGELQKREEDLAVALDEAQTEEDVTLVEGDIDKVIADIEEIKKSIEAVEGEVEVLKGELDAVEEKSARAQKDEMQTRKLGGNQVGEKMATREFNLMAKTTFEKKERMKQVLEVRENKEFYERVAEIVKTRAVGNADLLIPEIVIDMITIDMLDVGKIYNLVTTRTVPGTARIVMSGDTPDAIWLDCCGDLTELDLDFNMLEIDCYKVGGFVAICNSTLEDSFLNLALHIQEQLSKSIAIALDKAIINGTGATGKQLTGIIPSLPTPNKVTVTSDFKTVMSKFGLLPDDTGALTAVMTRQTYYTHFAPQTIATTSTGQVVSQSTDGAKLPDGTPVVFVSKDVIAENKMLLGDFAKYFLAQRKGLELATSTEVRFLNDQTVFKGTARYDGKPTKVNYWILLTLTAPTV